MELSRFEHAIHGCCANSFCENLVVATSLVVLITQNCIFASVLSIFSNTRNVGTLHDPMFASTD